MANVVADLARSVEVTRRNARRLDARAVEAVAPRDSVARRNRVAGKRASEAARAGVVLRHSVEAKARVVAPHSVAVHSEVVAPRLVVAAVAALHLVALHSSGVVDSDLDSVVDNRTVITTSRKIGLTCLGTSGFLIVDC